MAHNATCERIIDTVREGDARWGEPIAYVKCGEPTSCGHVVCGHECPAHEAERDEYLAWESAQMGAGRESVEAVAPEPLHPFWAMTRAATRRQYGTL